MVKRLGIALFWLAVWQLLALLVHNPVLLVGPWETLLALVDMLPTAEFRRALGGSLLHILGGFLLGSVLGVLLAFAAYARPLLRDLLSPVIGVMKAVPVVSFVVLVLIWAGSGALSLCVTAVVCLPILYLNTLEGLLGLDRKLLELAEVYHMGFSGAYISPASGPSSWAPWSWRWAWPGSPAWPPRSSASLWAAWATACTGRRSTWKRIRSWRYPPSPPSSAGPWGSWYAWP